jgi:transcriptional regulator with XRE-family HTH domain
VLRIARVELGWSQGELGARFGCSASTISRLESGHRGLRDVAVLRRFAAVLGLPTEAFGLTGGSTARPVFLDRPTRPSKVGSNADRAPTEEGDGPVRRRAFLLAAGLAGTAAAVGESAPRPETQVDPAAFLERRLTGALLADSTTGSRPVPIETLRAVLADARADFRCCHYVDLAARLPELITAAEATHAQLAEPASAAVLAHTYQLATRALIKLNASGVEWIAADRAVRAASEAGDPLVLAEAQRLLGSVFRRAGQHDRARTLTLAAADQLQLTDPGHLALYGVLMCSAGYAAARAGDRDQAVTLLGEADGTVGRLAGHSTARDALAANVLSHRVSAEYLLGNAGTALHHANTAGRVPFPDTERRARFLVDVALCYSQWDKPEPAYRTLLAAERTAPGEVRTRATVRRLVGDLLRQPGQAELPGLRQLAARTHAGRTNSSHE